MNIIPYTFQLIALLPLSLFLGGTSALAQSFENTAPYEDIIWKGYESLPFISIEGQWYQLSAIDELAVEDIVSFTKATYFNQWQKRFNEDLARVLYEMGYPPKKTVNLEVSDPESDQVVVLEGVAMTIENRSKIVQNRRLTDEKRATPEFRNRWLEADDLQADLDLFEKILTDQFAYLLVKPVDYKVAIDEIRRKASSGMRHSTFALELDKVISLFIDGHARLYDFGRTDGYLPFFLRPADGGIVAFNTDRKKLMDRQMPFVTHIDGLSIEKWIQELSPFIAKGSPQYIRETALSMMYQVQQVREMIGLPIKDSVLVHLTSLDGTESRTVTRPISTIYWKLDTLPLSESGVIDENIGYLRLPDMNFDAVDEIERWMPEFQDTKGLIIDVRGNTGGSRKALLELFPYFMTPKDDPHIANVAKYRLYEGFEDDHLVVRFMYTEDHDHWEERERDAITQFRRSFRPEWNPPEDQFSAWHYLVFAKKEKDPRYFYDRPAVILMDDLCFSATDIFLGAFKGWRNITLVGSASGGGSARSVGFELPGSRMRGRVASMVSFQPSGTLYDGNGVLPDLEVLPTPTDFLRNGQDTVLAAAIDYLKQSKE